MKRLVPVLCACSWSGDLPSDGACPECHRPCHDRITPARLEVLISISAGRAPEIFPAMRIRLLELGLILPLSRRHRPGSIEWKPGPQRYFRLTKLGELVLLSAATLTPAGASTDHPTATSTEPPSERPCSPPTSLPVRSEE